MEIKTLNGNSVPSIISNKYFQCHMDDGITVHRLPYYTPYFIGAWMPICDMKSQCYIKRR